MTNKIRITIRIGWIENIEPVAGESATGYMSRRKEELTEGLTHYIMPDNVKLDIDIRKEQQ